MPILRLVANLGLDRTGFDAGMRGAQKTAGAFGSSLKSALAGAFSLAAIGGFVRQIGEAVNRVKDLSEQFAVTTDEVQNADFALKQSGMSFEDLKTSFTTLGQKRREAVEGNIELRDTFLKYGVTLEQLNNSQLRTWDVMQRIAQASSNVNISAKEQAELLELLGTRSFKVVNVLKELETIKAPSLFTEADIKTIDDMTKAIERLKLSAQTMAAPMVSGTADLMSSLLAGGKAFLTGGPGGRINAAADAIRDAFKQNTIKNLGIPEIGKGAGLMGGVTSELIRKIIGIQKAEPPPIWEVDAKVKKLTSKQGSADVISSDQFQRIGAFTGASAEVAQNDLLRRQLTELEKIRDDLIHRGILVKTE